MVQFEDMGKFLRRKRLEADMSQGDLAKHLNLSSQMISNWERGLCAPPVTSLKDLTKVLKVDKEEMLNIFLASRELLLRMSLGMSTKRSVIKKPKIS